MIEAQDAQTCSQAEKKKACADTILKFWRHRHVLPDGKRPFEDIEPIIRALEAIDPENDTPRYFGGARNAARDSKLPPKTKQWLDLVDGIEYSAKVLIRYALLSAAKSTKRKAEKWVELAQEADERVEIELPVVRMISDEGELMGASDPDERKRKLLEDRIDRLDNFTEMAGALAEDMRAKLKTKTSKKPF